MTESTKRRTETEPFGITYDRMQLDRTITRLVRKHDIRTALELPADGAKAMPGIYSLAFARAGVHVHLFNPEPQALELWARLGLQDMYTVVEGDDPANTGLDPGQFDICWNFVSVGFRKDFRDIIAEMERCSKRFVMTVHCNGFNYGYPWHRFLHKALKLEWNHGETEYFFPKKVRETYRAKGLEPVDFGLLDMPWWPDPPGFRDVRLHLNGGDVLEDFNWKAPIEDIYRTGKRPFALRVLSRIERLPTIPTPVRFVFSHLFFVLGEKILR
ncbi:MAG: hypothetical protein ACJAYU_000787 [Bradymonadia bacterium]|jgi:hypothetical protein